jgi:hypothetical protein
VVIINHINGSLGTAEVARLSADGCFRITGNAKAIRLDIKKTAGFASYRFAACRCPDTFLFPFGHKRSTMNKPYCAVQPRYRLLADSLQSFSPALFGVNTVS